MIKKLLLAAVIGFCVMGVYADSCTNVHINSLDPKLLNSITVKDFEQDSKYRFIELVNAFYGTHSKVQIQSFYIHSRSGNTFHGRIAFYRNNKRLVRDVRGVVTAIHKKNDQSFDYTYHPILVQNYQKNPKELAEDAPAIFATLAHVNKVQDIRMNSFSISRDLIITYNVTFQGENDVLRVKVTCNPDGSADYSPLTE